MSRLPEMPRLPMNMQQPLCQRCLALGREARFMQILVGRTMEDDYGLMWFECRNCGTLSEPIPIPLFYLAATNVNELQQIIASHELAGRPVSANDLTPHAREIVNEYSLNPFQLAEAAALFAIKWQQEKEENERLRERLGAE